MNLTLTKKSAETVEHVGLQTVVLPRVNLLPPEIAERRTFQRVQMGLGGAVLAAVGLVALLYVGATASVNDAQTELDTATATGTALKAENAKYADVTATYARAAQAQAMLTQAMGEEIRWSRFMNDLSLTVPDNVWVTQLKFTQTGVSTTAPPAGSVPAAVPAGEPGIGSATFTGVGFAHDDVAVWLESLAKQKGYTNPYFSNATEKLVGSRKVVEFTSTTTLTSAALSGRYTAPAGG